MAEVQNEPRDERDARIEQATLSESKFEEWINSRKPNVPKLYRLNWERAVRGQASKRNAIKAKCAECCGWEDAQIRIRECTARLYPLWAYRPYQEKAQ